MEKRILKIHLSTIIYISIIITLIIILVFTYYIGFIKNSITYNQEINNLNEELSYLQNELNILEENENYNTINDNNTDNDNSSTTLDNNIKDTTNEESNLKYFNDSYYMDNNQLTLIDEKNKLFTLESPKISFKFPRNWSITTSNNANNILLESCQKGVSIRIIKTEYTDNSDLKNLLSLDYGSEILNEGTIQVSNHNGYYKEYLFGDALMYSRCKAILVDIGNNQYYEIFFSVDSNSYLYDYTTSELNEIFENNTSIFNNFISSLQF